MKTRKFLAMMIAAVTCLGAFTACGDDDDDNNGGSSSSRSVKSIQSTLTTYVNADLLKYVDVKGTYTDLTGTERSATLSTTAEKVEIASGTETKSYDVYPLRATYSFTSFPAVFTMNVTFTANGTTPTEKVTLVVVPNITSTINYSDGTSATSIKEPGAKVYVVQPEKFESALALIQKYCGSLSLNISADGSIE